MALTASLQAFSQRKDWKPRLSSRYLNLDFHHLTPAGCEGLRFHVGELGPIPLYRTGIEDSIAAHAAVDGAEDGHAARVYALIINELLKRLVVPVKRLGHRHGPPHAWSGY